MELFFCEDANEAEMAKFMTLRDIKFNAFQFCSWNSDLKEKCEFLYELFLTIYRPKMQEKFIKISLIKKQQIT